LPSEFTPKEDRGSFFIVSSAPQGASYGYSLELFDEVEKRLMYLLETGDATRVLVRVPRAFGANSDFNEVIAIVNLNDFGKRRDAWAIMDEVRGKLKRSAGGAALCDHAPGPEPGADQAGAVCDQRAEL
jgi:multidrug efflux pump